MRETRSSGSVRGGGGNVPTYSAIGALDVRPELGRALQTAADQPAQPRERWRGAPFSATRSRLSATASSRALSCSPEAASGGGASAGVGLRPAAPQAPPPPALRVSRPPRTPPLARPPR